MPDQPYPSPRLLREFLQKNSVTQEACGTAVGVTRITVWSWVHEESYPSEPLKEALHVWTNGEVPRDGWPPAKDRRKEPKPIVPFEPPVVDEPEPPGTIAQLEPDQGATDDPPPSESTARGAKGAA